MRPNRLLPCIFVFAGLVRADSACPVGEPPHVAVSLSSCRSTPHAAWGIAANVADQANEYCFLPSTVVNNTVLIPRDICSDPTQFGSRENCEQLFPPLPPLPASKDADLPKDPWWATINPPGLVAGIKGLFILPPRSELEDFNFGVVRGTSRNFSAPLLGLGPSSSLLAKLIDQKRISRNAWSLQLGELILGAYDQGSLGTAPLKEFSLQMPENDGRSIFGPRTCALKLLITKLEWDFLDGNGTIFNFEDAEPITACIEPNDEKFRFQSLWKNSILNSIRERSGSTSPALPSGSWIQEPGLNFLAKDFPRVGDMRITLERLNRGGEVKVTVPGTSLSRPLEGMSGGVVQPFPSTEEVMVFDGQVLDKTAVLGRVFLEQVGQDIDGLTSLR